MTKYSDNWTSIPEMLAGNASRFGSRTAIVAEEGRPLTHRELHVQVAAIVQALNHLGIAKEDRIAIALPQGPELAVAFLSVAACATAAPLNPAYLENEFRFQLEDLRAKALILPLGSESPARAAAQALGVPVLELSPSEGGSGRFGLSGVAGSLETAPVFAGPDDIALMLHTSGTTSRPKRVPLSHANLCASTHNIAATLDLQPGDLSLTVMPLFHIHGLVACVLAPLGAGGSCACVRSFQADQFARWLEIFKPTWVSAVPTMHQAILDCTRDISIPPSSLRFIRSSSAALPPTVMAGLEKVFGVPVIESYGMTEAAHQMASNPLPPRIRKAGSVGLPAGPRVAILDEAGKGLDSRCRGEVAIMGPNLTRGYENNPEANATAFSAGWFRTGDQGYLDEDGYLFITGRLKEIINRGSEKIVPREIDEALLLHPAVSQAVAFAVPHPSLGEDVAAAVVLHAGASSNEAEIRAFLFDRLLPIKVPSRIVFLDNVPKGPTGKIQRIGMAERLAESLAIAYEEPVSEMEKLVAVTIGGVLGRDRIGRHDNFFALGGDSLRATQVIVRLKQSLALELPAPLLFRLPTPALLAARLDELAASREMEMIEAALAALPAGERASLLDDAELAP